MLLLLIQINLILYFLNNYSADDLVGTQVCVVANLKPAKLMGMISEGMLLAARDENGLSLIRPEKPKTIGTKIS